MKHKTHTEHCLEETYGQLQLFRTRHRLAGINRCYVKQVRIFCWQTTGREPNV